MHAGLTSNDSSAVLRMEVTRSPFYTTLDCDINSDCNSNGILSWFDTDYMSFSLTCMGIACN
eukprot:CAMPEP_0116968252 /NCGR_PEP_ID=MMETSP0467-20121206/51094_1 /TAXON_ID=283647 /ORGANISM="Mesodinium pulex, Strain SPMC105" /LENGTH=61 /DNA_ID=CAMNT_0004658433 /DNA_START=97 /DNA_END=282 /DNA_ORIENTATION=+